MKNWKGITFIWFCILLNLVMFIQLATAASPTPFGPTADPDEEVVDFECLNNKLLGSKGISCNKTCRRSCLYAAPDYKVRIDQYCDKTYASPNDCRPNGLKVSPALDNMNFLGIDVDRAVLILIRRILLLVFALGGLLDVVLGLYATYKLSRSDGNSDKVEEAMKIYKSLVVGSIVLFTGIVLVQIAATVSGVTGDLLDFNFLPRTGRAVMLYEEDLGRKCYIEQQHLPASGGSKQYECDPETLVWVTP